MLKHALNGENELDFIINSAADKPFVALREVLHLVNRISAQSFIPIRSTKSEVTGRVKTLTSTQSIRFNQQGFFKSLQHLLFVIFLGNENGMSWLDILDYQYAEFIEKEVARVQRSSKKRKSYEIFARLEKDPSLGERAELIDA